MLLRNKVRRILYPVIIIAVIPCLIVIFYSVNKYRPLKNEVIYYSEINHELPETLEILTWNIGYAGLDENMDFFYEGGKQVRPERERSMENLSEIIIYLSKCDADIILLQEVDIYSKRSYRINQFELISGILSDYRSLFAFNFSNPFIPIPLKNPIGRVESGLALFSKYEPFLAVRHSLPLKKSSFPMNFFDFNRCVLSCTYYLGNEKYFTVYNIHNSAYEDLGHRKRELDYIRDSLIPSGTNSFAIGGDWNQNPTGYSQSYKEKNNKYFRPGLLESDFSEHIGKIYYDPEKPTARYLYEPYNENTTTTLIDFFMASEDVECLDIKTDDLGFRNSDHNPVLINIRIKK